MRTLSIEGITLTWDEKVQVFVGELKQTRLHVQQVNETWAWAIIYTKDEEAFEFTEQQGFDRAQTAADNLGKLLLALGAIHPAREIAHEHSTNSPKPS